MMSISHSCEVLFLLHMGFRSDTIVLFRIYIDPVQELDKNGQFKQTQNVDIALNKMHTVECTKLNA